MRLLLPLMVLLWPLAAPAQEAPDPAQGAAIEEVIRDQLADFNARDVPGAWEHASPMIQGMFGTPGNFGTMVENGYPMVWTNSAAEFLDMTEEGGTLHQKVRIRDAQGRGWLLDYSMVQVEGEWRIDGVTVVPAPDLAA